VIQELLTREDYYEAIMSGQGAIVVVDTEGRTAHPVSCPTLEASHFVEKVIINERKNGRYYLASSFPEARRALDADPCHCS
jgi:hypothetical protein